MSTGHENGKRQKVKKKKKVEEDYTRVETYSLENDNFFNQ
jgi:hypothetical protein